MNQNRPLTGRLFACLSVTVAFVAAAPHATAQNLGAASDYNYFVFGDTNLQNTDVEGRAAIGGNATFVNYGVGDKLPASSAYSLVVEGNLNYTNGQVFQGNVRVGGTATLSGFNVQNGSLSYGDLIDFDTAKANLNGLSNSLANATANSAYSLSYGNLVFSGTDNSLNVFNISGADFNTANSIAVNTPSGSTVVINVSGSSIHFDNLGMSVSGTDRSRVIYNFYQADTLNIGGISVQGSILAPKAAVNFSNGNIEGTLVSNSLSGGGEFHYVPFNGNLTVVPEASTAALGALGALALLRRRR